MKNEYRTIRHIAAVIPKNLTGDEAEDLLGMMTRNSTDARIGNNVTISSSNLYLLHLPSDVLASVPMSVQNDGLGPGPNYLDPLGVIVSILLFPFEAAFFIIGVILVLTFMLVDLCLKVIGQMISSAATVIKQAVDTLVNALNAFVSWVIQFIKDTFNALITQPINDLWNAIISWTLGFVRLVSDNANKVSSGQKTLSDAAFDLVEYFLNNQVIQIVIILVVLLATAIAIIEPFMAPFSFLIAIVAPIVIELVIKGLATVVEGLHWLMDAVYQGFQAFAEGAQDLLASESVQVSNMVVSLFAAWGAFFFGKIELLTLLGEGKILKEKVVSALGFIMSCFGVIIAMHDLQGSSEDGAIWKMAGLCTSGLGFLFVIWAGPGNILSKIIFGFSSVGLFTSIIGVTG